jgi:hypothetical protein
MRKNRAPLFSHPIATTMRRFRVSHQTNARDETPRAKRYAKTGIAGINGYRSRGTILQQESSKQSRGLRGDDES